MTPAAYSDWAVSLTCPFAMVALMHGAAVAAWCGFCAPPADGAGRAVPHKLHRT